MLKCARRTACYPFGSASKGITGPQCAGHSSRTQSIEYSCDAAPRLCRVAARGPPIR